MDIFLLKINADVLVLKGSGVIQTINRVSGKSADGLGNHHIDLAIMAVVYHALKLITLLGIHSGDAIICINSSQYPVRMALNVGGIMLDLGVVAGFLFITVRTDSAVGCDSGSIGPYSLHHMNYCFQKEVS